MTCMLKNAVPFKHLSVIIQTMFVCLYFVGRASRYKFLEVTNLTHFFVYLFIYLFIYFMSVYEYVSSVTALIIRRSNCINTSSGMISLCK